MNQALYKLEKVTDNPQYEGFAFVRDESLRGKGRLAWDFHTNDRETKGRAWSVPKLAPLWSPQQVTGRVRSFNDYPCVNLTVPAFSLRAVEALREFLEPNGELLPLVSTVGEYFAYNITTVADILDQERSRIVWLDDLPKSVDNVYDIDHYECIPDKLAGLSIFHLVEMPAFPYVTQQFVNRVKEHDLRGFHFAKLWPLPDGTSWRDLDRKQSKEEQKVETSRGQIQSKENTVVLFIPLARAKPSKDEKQRVAKLKDEIDAMLYDSAADSDATYFGSLEGDDYVKGEYRLFLSCPDADALVERLRPWLKRLSWERPVKLMKRYGNYVEPDCREEWVNV